MSTLFKYETQGRPVTFLDDADAYDNETIRKHWQTSFPELGNCQAETKAAPKAEKLKETTAEGQEVEVDRVVTFVKKVGTKGAGELTEDEARTIIERATAPDATEEERQRFYEAYQAARHLAAGLADSVPPEFRTAHSDPARQRLIDAAPVLSRLCKRLIVQASTVLERPCEVNFTALQIAVNDGIEAMARVEGVWPEAPQTPAWQPGDRLLLDYLNTDGKVVKVSFRLAMAAPKMLAVLWAAVAYVRVHPEIEKCPFCQVERSPYRLHMGDCPWPAIRQAIADATGEPLAGEAPNDNR